MQKIRLTQPGELLAAVPYLIGFHPSDSLVLIGIRAGHLHFAARADLDECRAGPEPSARHLATVLARQRIDAAVIIGYGPPGRVTPVVDAVRQAVVGRGIPIADALRVTDGRFYSYDCPDPGCCPPAGRAFRPESSVIAAEATLAGHVALPDRATLARSLAPIGDLAGVSMARATDRAEARLITSLEQPGGQQALAIEGAELIEAALSRHYTGGVLTDDEAAWLSTLLILVEVRDAASRMIEQHPDDPHIPLWTDLVRRARPGMVAPVGTLLAYAAYLAGQGSLASVALERARADDPRYPMAQLLQDAILHGIPPGRLRPRRVRRRHQGPPRKTRAKRRSSPG